MRKLSVRPSDKRVHCDKTKEGFAKICKLDYVKFCSLSGVSLK